MTVADPFSFAGAWDQITINGLTWGGPLGSGVLSPSFPMYPKIRVEGATRFYKVDQKDGQGLDGATQTYRGVKPKPFKLRFIWYTSAQHIWWATYSQMFIYTGSKVVGIPPVFDVSYPALQLLAISAILIDEVGQVDVNEDTKLAQAVVVCRQFYPPPPVPATKTPVAAPPVPSVGAGATGISPLAAENIATQAQISAVSAQLAAGGVPSSLPH